MNHRVVVMGVAGCGKSTLAHALAKSLACEVLEGDDYHPPSNTAKMSSGQPLDDADRWPWLRRLADQIQGRPAPVVASCSALKRSYRSLLRELVPSLRFVYIEITPAVAAERVAARSDHLFPVALVSTQFATLQPPLGEPATLVVTAADTLDHQVSAVRAWLGDPVLSSPLITS
jgi:gluconokinase